MPRIRSVPVVALVALAALPGSALACACGCGVFGVGNASSFPQGPGTSAYLQYAYLDQTDRWSGSGKAADDGEGDRDIRTQYATLGVRHMFDRAWSVSVELPHVQRHFVTAEDGPAESVDHGGIGDVRVLAGYSGFSPDLSSGLQFGIKLASGDWKHPGFDRDTQLGSGSTDLLLGGFHRTRLGADGAWTGFAQGMLDLPALTRDGYRPGVEFNAAFGAYYTAWHPAAGVTLAPVLQGLVSLRAHDRGRESESGDTGYQRLLAAPGLELDWRRLRLFADVELPVFQHVRGEQLVAPWQARLEVGYRF